MQLFCTGLNLLSQIITKRDLRNWFRNGTIISHFFYVNDIKLYAKSEQGINSLNHITRIYSTDIDMSFGPDKCSRTITKTGKLITTEGIEIPEGN